MNRMLRVRAMWFFLSKAADTIGRFLHTRSENAVPASV